MKRKKQLLSWILSFLMVFSIMPMISISAFATEYDNNHIVVSDTLKPGDIIKNRNPKDTITIYYEGLDTIGVPAGEQHTVCDFQLPDGYMFNWKVNTISTSGEGVDQIELTQNWKKVHKIAYDMTNITVSEIDVDGEEYDIDGQTCVTTGSAVTITIAADTGCTLPDAVTVEMGGSTLGDSEYKYDQATGEIGIDNVTGDVEITALGVEEETPPTPPTPPIEPPTPSVTTAPAISIGQISSIGKTSATLRSSITPGEEIIINQGFEWKETDGGTYIQKTGTLNNGILTATLKGLTKNTRYTIRPFVVTETDTYYGAENTFRTKKNTRSGSSSGSSGSSGSDSKSEILVGELTNEAIINNLKTSEYKKIQVNIDSNPNLLLSKSVIDDLIANKDKTLIIVSNNVSTNITINEKNEMQFTRNGSLLAGFVSVCNAEYYLNYNGIVQKGWIQFPGETWYYLDKETGIKAKGWINDNGTWYYSNSVGVMQTGWINDSGTWYYLSKSGEMLANTTIDGYVLGASGAWIG